METGGFLELTTRLAPGWVRDTTSKDKESDRKGHGLSSHDFCTCTCRCRHECTHRCKHRCTHARTGAHTYPRVHGLSLSFSYSFFLWYREKEIWTKQLKRQVSDEPPPQATCQFLHSRYLASVSVRGSSAWQTWLPFTDKALAVQTKFLSK